MLSWYKGDLHIHSVLSPCAELEMGPKNIMAACHHHGIDLISIADHNSSANVPAFMAWGQREGVTVIPGIEVQTREEVHCLCYFPDLTTLQGFENKLRTTIPSIKNREEIFGEQLIINEKEEIIGKEDNMLLMSSSWGMRDLVKEVHQSHGVVVPAHIDKKSFSLLGNLGPPGHDEGYASLEVFSYDSKEALIKTYPVLKQYNFMVSSDAHTIADLDCRYRSYFYMEAPTWEEFMMALRNINSRKVVVS